MLNIIAGFNFLSSSNSTSSFAGFYEAPMEFKRDINLIVWSLMFLSFHLDAQKKPQRSSTRLRRFGREFLAEFELWNCLHFSARSCRVGSTTRNSMSCFALVLTCWFKPILIITHVGRKTLDTNQVCAMSKLIKCGARGAPTTVHVTWSEVILSFVSQISERRVKRGQQHVPEKRFVILWSASL